MRTFIGRLLGYDNRLDAFEQRCQKLVAQRDANREGWEMAAQQQILQAARLLEGDN